MLSLMQFFNLKERWKNALNGAFFNLKER